MSQSGCSNGKAEGEFDGNEIILPDSETAENLTDLITDKISEDLNKSEDYETKEVIEIIPHDRRINWKPGVPGGIPDVEVGFLKIA